MNYKECGVDIEAGQRFVELISEKVKSTHTPQVLGGFGGFNGMMRVPEGYERPVLVSGTDGVGTKINVGQIFNNDEAWYCLGRDLVAMCVNDVICSGSKPLYFLDYIATGKLDENVLKQIVFGIGDGCHEAQCALLGGETAEMPRMYSHGKFDLAGFCTGIVEETEIIDGKLIRKGDKVIGIASSGIHSNGYSMINNMLFHQHIKAADTPELIEPTRIYHRMIQELLDEVPIVGMAHITGGGIPGNLPRCLPEGLDVHVDYTSWDIPPIFDKIQNAGSGPAGTSYRLPDDEMRKVFNMGIGFCIVVPADVEYDTRKIIWESNGVKSWVIGEVC